MHCTTTRKVVRAAKSTCCSAFYPAKHISVTAIFATQYSRSVPSQHAVLQSHVLAEVQFKDGGGNYIVLSSYLGAESFKDLGTTTAEWQRVKIFQEAVHIRNEEAADVSSAVKFEHYPHCLV